MATKERIEKFNVVTDVLDKILREVCYYTESLSWGIALRTPNFPS